VVALEHPRLLCDLPRDVGRHDCGISVDPRLARLVVEPVDVGDAQAVGLAQRPRKRRLAWTMAADALRLTPVLFIWLITTYTGTGNDPANDPTALVETCPRPARRSPAPWRRR
jgi:hypothetical protein